MPNTAAAWASLALGIPDFLHVVFLWQTFLTALTVSSSSEQTMKNKMNLFRRPLGDNGTIGCRQISNIVTLS